MSAKASSNSLTGKFLDQFHQKIELLEPHVFQSNPGINGSKTVFISICNGKDRASVFHESRENFESAWRTTVLSCEKFIKKEGLKPLWVKADVVINKLPVDGSLINKTISGYRPYFMRKGISFDPDFKSVYLEAELNGCGIIDYRNKEINPVNLMNYQKKKGDILLKNIPEKVFFFDALGFFCDSDNQVYPLLTKEIDYGRRPSDAGYPDILSAVESASKFLFNSIQPDGSFVYGYHPLFNKEIGSYNILRHTSTTWTLLNQYKMTKDESLVPAIEKVIRYMTENHIVHKDENTCFLLEKTSNEIKLGGNGIAVVVLCIYMELFDTDCFRDLVCKLGNGILSLQDHATGSYYHVLNYPDFTPKDAYRIVYYDGEATFALSKLYSLTKETRWLDAAMKSVDYFIENHYEKYVDHWIAYAVNELTLYEPSEKYLSFGLKNVQVNLEKIYHQDTSFHTYMEMLMITFVMYDRMKEKGIASDYLKNDFNETRFLETIHKRATHMLNGYLYPEYAMYLKSPATVLGAFCVRHHGYRVRIDDVQHFLGGYYLYLDNYQILENFKKDHKESGNGKTGISYE